MRRGASEGRLAGAVSVRPKATAAISASAITAYTQNTAAQPLSATAWPPISGAATGMIPKTAIMRASRCAACSRAYRSRTMERAMTGPLDMARPCAKRSRISACTDCAAAPQALETKNRPKPASSTGLRP